MSTAAARHLQGRCIPQACTWCIESLDNHDESCGCSDCVLEREERAIDAREQNDLDDYMEGGW